MIRNKDVSDSEKSFRYAYDKYRELVEGFASGPARLMRRYCTARANTWKGL